MTAAPLMAKQMCMRMMSAMPMVIATHDEGDDNKLAMTTTHKQRMNDDVF